jgi:hypothetical protein
MQFQANGTVRVTRSDDMGCVACREGRTIAIVVVTIRVHPICIELIDISFGCTRFRVRPFGTIRTEKATGKV